MTFTTYPLLIFDWKFACVITFPQFTDCSCWSFEPLSKVATLTAHLMQPLVEGLSHVASKTSQIWKFSFPNLTLNQPVLLVEESPMTLDWTLGIIVELHPGTDCHVHIITVCTKHGLFTLNGHFNLLRTY